MTRPVVTLTAAIAISACGPLTGPAPLDDSTKIEISADCGQDLQAPSRVHCTGRLDTQQANVVGLQWDMGDGRHAGGMSLSYAYIAPGSYTVRVRAITRPDEWQHVANFSVPSFGRIRVKSSSGE
jgi:hypothetical protein